MKSRKGEWEIEDDTQNDPKNLPHSKTSQGTSNLKQRKREEKLLDLDQSEGNQRKIKKKREEKLLDLDQSEGNQRKKKKKREEKLLDLEQSEDDTCESKIKRKKKSKNKKTKTHSSQIVDCNKDKCLDYLKRWQEDRETWKFEKLRQIWLFRNMLDSTKVPGSSFQILVNYISGTRGHARQMIVSKTMEVVKTMEKWTELSEQGMKDEDIACQVSSGKVTEEMYERARSVLQSLEDV